MADAFTRVNPGYALDGSVETWQHSLHVINSQIGEIPSGAVELITEPQTPGLLVTGIEVTANIDDIAATTESGVSHMVGDVLATR